jgi:hypothetical protein
MPTAEAERAVIEPNSARFDRGENFEYFPFEFGAGDFVGTAGVHVRQPETADVGYWVRSDRKSARIRHRGGSSAHVR